MQELELSAEKINQEALSSAKDKGKKELKLGFIDKDGSASDKSVGKEEQNDSAPGSKQTHDDSKEKTADEKF